jgi:hypothetical protein
MTTYERAIFSPQHRDKDQGTNRTKNISLRNLGNNQLVANQRHKWGSGKVLDAFGVPVTEVQVKQTSR